MQHTWKVGDKARHAAQTSIEAEIVYISGDLVCVKYPSGSIQVAAQSNLIPPPPTVVYERFHILYNSEDMAPVSSDSYYSKELARWHAHGADAGFLRIYLLSDGTWKIEKVG